MGLEGAAWATLISRIAAMIGTAGYCLHISGASLAAISPLPIPWGTVRSLFLIGAPVGLQYFSEVAAFNFGAIMIGWLGTSALAAHQIAITCAATTFMFPLGISQAVSVRIGQAVGAGAHHLVRLIGYGGLMLSAAVMALFALLFGLFGREIALAFNSDPRVVGIAVGMLIIAGLFQLADGVQVTAMGALRGLADVRVPMALAYLFYWGCAIPVAYVLAFVCRLGPNGVWSGLAIGLFFAATVLSLRFIWLTRPGRHFTMVVREPASSEQ